MVSFSFILFDTKIGKRFILTFSGNIILSYVYKAILTIIKVCPAQAIKERKEDFDHTKCFEKLKE
jgi:hypothetical protein